MAAIRKCLGLVEQDAVSFTEEDIPKIIAETKLVTLSDVKFMCQWCSDFILECHGMSESTDLSSMD
eukprot:4075410-Karenia_brevis.AAC.1